MNQGQPHGDLAARSRPGSEPGSLFRLPAGEGLVRASMVVHAPEESDLFVLEPRAEEQVPQVLLGRDRLREDHGLAAAVAVTAAAEDEPDRLQERARLGIARKGPGTSEEFLHAGQLRQDPVVVHRRGRWLVFDWLLQLLLVLQVAEHRDSLVVSGLTCRETAEPLGDVLQACGQCRDRRAHAPVESDQQEPALSAGERVERRLEQILGHIVIERPFVGAHRVLVETAPPLRERPLEELLRLPPQRPLEHQREAPLELVLLPGDQTPVILVTEHPAERREIAEQSACRLDVLHQPP